MARDLFVVVIVGGLIWWNYPDWLLLYGIGVAILLLFRSVGWVLDRGGGHGPDCPACHGSNTTDYGGRIAPYCKYNYRRY